MNVGQKVRVRKLRDAVGGSVNKRIGEVGVVKAPKILDGQIMGYVVAFADNQTTWFFPEELEVVYG
ncbi:MAG: cytochrome b6f subunit family protein [Pseudanabaenaceae cyanobacterium]